MWAAWACAPAVEKGRGEGGGTRAVRAHNLGRRSHAPRSHTLLTKPVLSPLSLPARQVAAATTRRQERFQGHIGVLESPLGGAVHGFHDQGEACPATGRAACFEQFCAAYFFRGERVQMDTDIFAEGSEEITAFTVEEIQDD